MESSKTAKSPFRRLLHTFIPKNFHDIFGLTFRLLKHGEAAGRMAMVYSLLGVIFTPLDLLLQPFERKLYQKAQSTDTPLIFVCGAARSGTTAMGQMLIRFLPVQYFNNLTSIFPRSPIMADKLFGWMARNDNQKVSTKNFYGRTAKLNQPNDALYFWDRWNGADRKVIPSGYDEATATAMRQFFDAQLDFHGKPILEKNNGMNTYANLVANNLPNACFVCMDRDPVFLAQSHLQARRFIHGSEDVPYGMRGPIEGTPPTDPIEDICQQVMFHRRIVREMEATIPPDRFIRVPYESFCERPAELVAEIANRFLGLELDPADIQRELPPVRAGNKQKIDDETFARIQQYIDELMPKAPSSL